MTKKPSRKKRAARPRTAERARERQLEKLFEARQQLASLEPGGSPERPLEVGSASVIELRAEAEPCLRCGLPVRAEEHSSVQSANGLLRVVCVRCRACGASRHFYLRILENRLN